MVRLRSHLRTVRRVVGDRRRLARADAAVVSFPKSGRTWVRVLLSRLCQRQWGLPDDFLLTWKTLAGVDRSVPRILFTHDTWRLPAGLMRLPRRSFHRVPVAFLARHPADVLVSLQLQLRHRTKDRYYRWSAQCPLPELAWHQRFGLPAIVTLMNVWAAEGRRHPRFLMQRYEDYRRDAARELGALAAHLGLPADAAAIADAVEFAAFERMREREQTGFYTARTLRPGTSAKPEALKVRSGKVGGWRDHFSTDDVARIERYLATELDPVFGYGERPGSG